MSKNLYVGNLSFQTTADDLREAFAQHGNVTRQIYSIRATVRPGNSGGPLLATDGGVYGVVFAASTDSADTGYVLTAAEVGSDARAGRTATQSVSTQGCR